MNKKIAKLWKLFRYYSEIRTGIGLVFLHLYDDGSGSLHGSSIISGTVKLQSWNCVEAGIETMKCKIKKEESSASK